MKKTFTIILVLGLILSFVVLATPRAYANELIIGEPGEYDVVVYGASSAGVTAAIAAKREGASVILISQNTNIGGLTSSGLGATDIANKNVVGGIAYDFYHRVWQYYQNPDVWVSQTKEEYLNSLKFVDREAYAIFGGWDDAKQMMWVFEPKVADMIFKEMLIEAGVPVILNMPIDLNDGATVDPVTKRVTEIRSVTGEVFKGQVFIDASYEGDLMMLSGVTYRIGREGNHEFGETMNGLLTNPDEYYNSSPYIVPGDPNSGLLPYIEDKPLGTNGEADGRVQAYTFRFTLSLDPNNQIPISKPENYHPEWYETRARQYVNNPNMQNELTQNLMPNLKTDTNHADFVGMSYEYADGDYLKRVSIDADHRDYALGLLYFYAYDERVPLHIREDMRRYGLAKDEFLDNGNFPVEIYLREGRRMVSDYVMKESDVIQTSVPGVIEKTTAPFSVGQGFYWFDSHRVAHYINGTDDAYLTDGNFWAQRRDYPISYQSIIPKRGEATNLYIPVALSSTHAAYGSIRMETTYMIIGESAGTAAGLIVATNPQIDTHDLDYATLAIKLAQNGQLLGDVNLGPNTENESALLSLVINDVIDQDLLNQLKPYVVGGKIFDAAGVLLLNEIITASAQKVFPEVELGKEVITLRKAGILSNPNVYYPIMSETPPETFPLETARLFVSALATYFAKPKNGIISTWVNYLYELEIITEDVRNHLDENAISGGNVSPEITRQFLIDVAKAMNPTSDQSNAIYTFTSNGIIGSIGSWQTLFDGTATDVSESNLNTIISRIYDYFMKNPNLENQLGITHLNALLAYEIVSEDMSAYLLQHALENETVSYIYLRQIILNAAKIVDFTANENTALTVLMNFEASTLLNEFDTLYTETLSYDGVMTRTFLKELAAFANKQPHVVELSDDLLNLFAELGLIASVDKAYFKTNANNGFVIDRLKVMQMVETLALRINSLSTNSLQTLINHDVLTEDDLVLYEPLFESENNNFDGRLTNILMKKIETFLTTNGEFVSSQVWNQYVDYGVIDQNLKNRLQFTVSTYGQVANADARTLIENMAKLVNPALNQASDYTNLLQATRIVTDATYWNELFTHTDPVSGTFTRTLVANYHTFMTTYYSDYKFLLDEEVITESDYSFWIINSFNGSIVQNDKIGDLLTKLALEIRIDAELETAVSILNTYGFITNTAVWNLAIENPEQTTTLNNLNVLIKNLVIYFKNNDPIDPEADIVELSDELLTYFTSQGIFSGATYNAQYFKDNAKIGGGVLNVGETKNMLTRAFRKITGGAQTATTVIDIAISNYGFTFSDDPTTHAEMYQYWNEQIMKVANATVAANGGINGEALRVLMVHIYDILINEEA